MCDPSALRDEFRFALQQLAGGVCILTTGDRHDYSGMTLTSVSSFSVEPPTLIACIKRDASSVRLLENSKRFCINILAASQEQVARDFSGESGLSGRDRFCSAGWKHSFDRSPALAHALANIHCEVEEIIPRHTHLITIGSVVKITSEVQPDALVYLRARYAAVGAGQNEALR